MALKNDLKKLGGKFIAEERKRIFSRIRELEKLANDFVGKLPERLKERAREGNCHLDISYDPTLDGLERKCDDGYDFDKDKRKLDFGLIEGDHTDERKRTVRYGDLSFRVRICEWAEKEGLECEFRKYFEQRQDSHFNYLEVRRLEGITLDSIIRNYDYYHRLVISW